MIRSLFTLTKIAEDIILATIAGPLNRSQETIAFENEKAAARNDATKALMNY